MSAKDWSQVKDGDRIGGHTFGVGRDGDEPQPGIRHALKSAANNAGVCAVGIASAIERAKGDGAQLAIVPTLEGLHEQAQRIERELRALIEQGLAALKR